MHSDSIALDNITLLPIFSAEGLLETGKQSGFLSHRRVKRRSHCPVCFVYGIRYFIDEKQNRGDSER
jgi:hypothetical protein